jgi:hypothetical protein
LLQRFVTPVLEGQPQNSFEEGVIAVKFVAFVTADAIGHLEGSEGNDIQEAG